MHAQRTMPWLQVCGYLQVLLTSISGPVVLEAASGILTLARVADRVLAAAPILAIGALIDLWDHDTSSASHSQIMDIVCANLDALQVGQVFRASQCWAATCACFWPWCATAKGLPATL